MKYTLRDGTETDAATWASKQGDPEYLQVAKTHLPNGRWVSTLWLGVSPVFETVVFDDATRTGLDRASYDNEAAAVAGHDTLVAKWRL